MQKHSLIREQNYYKENLQFQSIRNWGCDAEIEHYNALHFEKRRNDWMLGRITAKELVQNTWMKYLKKTVSLNEIQIVNDYFGKPQILLNINNDWKLISQSLSISHCHNIAVCSLLSDAPAQNIGIDLEYINDRPALFAETFMHKEELKQLEKVKYKQAYNCALTSLWSLKEAFLKAVGVGLRINTKKINCDLSDWTFSMGNIQQAKIYYEDLEALEAEVKKIGEYIFTSVIAGKQIENYIKSRI